MRLESLPDGVTVIFDDEPSAHVEGVAKDVTVIFGANDRIHAITVRGPAWVDAVSASGKTGKAHAAVLRYDEEVDIALIETSGTKYKDSEETSVPGLIVDYDQDDNVTAIEIMDASRRFSTDALKQLRDAA
jgi:uncharacterized protein YuzE